MDMRGWLEAEDKQHRTHLEELREVMGGLQEEVKAQGDRIAQETAQTVEAAGREAVAQAQASLDQVAQAARKVGELAHQASETTGKAAQRSEELLGRLDQASQRMVASGQKVEAGLDGLLPKVAGIREGLEKELGGAVSAAAAAEEEVKKMIASIQVRLTKEIESEIRGKLHKAANDATKRIYGIADWWSWFSKVGTPGLLVAMALAGWWFGKHQVEENTYQKAMEALRANVRVGAWGMQVKLDPEGRVLETHPAQIKGILVPVGNGKWEAMERRGNDWYFRGNPVPDAKGYSIAEAYDSTRKEDNIIGVYRP